MSCGLPQPGPHEDFTLRRVDHADVAQWFHVYCTAQYPGTSALSFAQGWGDTRFAPLSQADGSPVHTYYAASTAEAAYMESVLHDCVLAPPGLFEVDSLQHYRLATLALPASLDCISFHSKDLPRLQNMARAQLIDSPPHCYAETRAWAQAAFSQAPQAQAIAYGSRRDDSARCLMLFKQRLPQPPLQLISDEPLSLGKRRAEVLALVRSLKLHEI